MAAAFCFPYKLLYNAAFQLSENIVCGADKAAVLHPCQTPVLYRGTGSSTHSDKIPLCGEVVLNLSILQATAVCECFT